MPRSHGEKRTELKYFTPLKFGLTPDGTEVTLSDESREKNGLLILGTKGSGKSEMIPELFWQDIVVPQQIGGEDKTPISNACLVYIISKPDQAYYLYAMGKKYHRNTYLIKPSTSNKVMNELLGAQEYNYDEFNEIINFEDGIRKRDVYIVDMEAASYGELSKIAVGMVLMQLQIAMHKTSKTARRRVFLTVDDAHLYLPFLGSLLEFGSDYNICPTLIFQNRAQYREYQGVIESNIQNYLLMPNLVFEDAKYFSENFFFESPQTLVGMGRDNYFCSFLNDLRRDNLRCHKEESLIDEHEDELLSASAAKYKKQLLRAEKEELYAAKIQREYAKYLLAKQKKINPGTSGDTVAEEALRSLEMGAGGSYEELMKSLGVEGDAPTEEDIVPIRTLGNDEEVVDDINDAPKVTAKRGTSEGLERILKGAVIDDGHTPKLVNKEGNGLDLSRIEFDPLHTLKIEKVPDPAPAEPESPKESETVKEPEQDEEEFFFNRWSMQMREEFQESREQGRDMQIPESKPEPEQQAKKKKKKHKKRKKPQTENTAAPVEKEKPQVKADEPEDSVPEPSVPEEKAEVENIKPTERTESVPEEIPKEPEPEKEMDDLLSMLNTEIETSSEDEEEFDLAGSDMTFDYNDSYIPEDDPDPINVLEPIDPEPVEAAAPEPDPPKMEEVQEKPANPQAEESALEKLPYDESLDDLVITLGEETPQPDSFSLGGEKKVNSKRRFFGRPIFVTNRRGNLDENALANEFNKKLR